MRNDFRQELLFSGIATSAFLRETTVQDKQKRRRFDSLDALSDGCSLGVEMRSSGKRFNHSSILRVC